jgi:glycosyltransferase involved in cell wall biosynthesis
MRVLYVASDQKVPGRTGGSVHVEEVATGLRKRGHEVHVVALSGEGGFPDLHPPRMLAPHRFFRWTAKRTVRALLDELRADAVMERYYNFGGEGVRAAFERGIPALLEVNSPLKDHPGSLKSALDAALLLRPMRRLREEICRKSSALVTPLQGIVPDTVPKEKVHRVSWGANVERFRPEGPAKDLGIPEGRKVIVFSGSFRPWHGADLVVRAAPYVRSRVPEAFFLFVGDGPSWQTTKDLARELGVGGHCLFAGAVSYSDMPSVLRRAQVGVAPYVPRRLSQMQLGFYWSPLKIFEYMATGIPVVTIDVPELAEVVRQGEEGLLFPEGDAEALAGALTVLLENPASRAMGEAARERVVSRFSWQVHCQELESILEGLVLRR